MKKFFPIAIFLVGILFVVGIFLLIRGKKEKPEVVEEEVIPEISLEKRPVVSLTPTKDGHWLKLSVDKIEISASSLDYELLYKLPDGRTQGVPGTVSLGGKKDFERDLLLGSESSGKFRYDEGVENGTLTIRFRNDKGKLLGKLTTDFHLQTGVADLSSVDGKFKFSLDKKPKEGFFVIIETFGLPNMVSKTIASGPYGIFSSVTDSFSGNVKMDTYKVYRYAEDSKWELYADGASVKSNGGIFVGVSE